MPAHPPPLRRNSALGNGARTRNFSSGQESSDSDSDDEAFRGYAASPMSSGRGFQRPRTSAARRPSQSSMEYVLL